MHISTPAHVLKLQNRDGEITDDGMHYLLRMKRDSSSFLLDHSGSQPTKVQLRDAASHMTAISDIEFTSDQVEKILELYPHARIGLAMNGISSARDELSFVVAHFFLGCNWPTFGDSSNGVNIEEFVSLLQTQARSMGYSCILASTN